MVFLHPLKIIVEYRTVFRLWEYLLTRLFLYCACTGRDRKVHPNFRFSRTSANTLEGQKRFLDKTRHGEPSTKLGGWTAAARRKWSRLGTAKVFCRLLSIHLRAQPGCEADRCPELPCSTCLNNYDIDWGVFQWVRPRGSSWPCESFHLLK